MRLVDRVIHVSPIAINSESSIPMLGSPMKAYGFGLTGDGNPSTVLRVGDFEPIRNDVCSERTYGIGNANITNDILCADPIITAIDDGDDDVDDDGRDKDTAVVATTTVPASICQGDSGSPLIDVETGTLVGIVSFNFKCVVDSFPGKVIRDRKCI